MQFYRSGRIVASSALVTEPWALCIACAMALDMGVSKAISESDCRVAIDCINSKIDHDPWEIAALVADIKKWAVQKEWTFKWAGREQNAAAHWIVMSKLDSSFSCLPGCILPELSCILAKDCKFQSFGMK